jgi:predicted nucleic acid-binding protein
VIVYVDTSALVKCYVIEAGSGDVRELIAAARLVGTAVITRVEMAAALAKAVRTGTLLQHEATAALDAFQGDWDSLVRLQLSEVLLARAASLAWQYGLRGYDAVHLASASFWREILGEFVSLVTYDRQLWEAARVVGLEVFPGERP